MSTLRLPYYQLSPEAYQGLAATKKALEASSLGAGLIELVYLRISQINGCAFCLEMHSKALRARGEEQARLDALAGWRVSGLYSEKERAALEWAESLTRLEASGAPDSAFEPLRSLFSEAQIADLSFAVALMNAFNRLAVGMRQ
ncbi:alkyl hydroperoxide reductase AhpD [Pseudomonas tohonis]|uniref:Alkyl hydroperoxide reductase AhpD n=1 Tax=Pseudomonas tohonis TaxID=2725477 RepID=A0A6J4EBQ2_9PSED|nr:carboxymuconolactone decarboxylase family protein [Pseudomonas tohonis]BCG27207.1 alkyl hydroperoxide reductase AhpD [Pseudomonas tohonis]GJN54642.1 alkyl hydroperoxide reductase AhpD [Pseudomonas tohonis]